VSIGIDRIILGTAAIEGPAFVQEACAKFPGRIIVGIDAKEGPGCHQGVGEVTKVKAIDLAKQDAGPRRHPPSSTPISSATGMLSGPNIEATHDLAKALHIPVIASGGVHTMKDIEICLR